MLPSTARYKQIRSAQSKARGANLLSEEGEKYQSIRTKGKERRTACVCRVRRLCVCMCVCAAVGNVQASYCVQASLACHPARKQGGNGLEK